MCVLLYKEQQMWIESPPKTKYTRLYMCLCVREIRKIDLHTYVTLCQKKTHIPLWKSSQEWNKELWHIIIQLSLSLSLFLFSEFECSTERRVTCTKERQFHRLFFPFSPSLSSFEKIALFSFPLKAFISFWSGQCICHMSPWAQRMREGSKI